MPVPPDYEPTKKPMPYKFPQLDWVFLLIAGIACVFISNGDLTAIGNQLTGSALTAFRFIVKQRNEDED
jgi:uncharacterized membrane-anchored protein